MSNSSHSHSLLVSICEFICSFPKHHLKITDVLCCAVLCLAVLWWFNENWEMKKRRHEFQSGKFQCSKLKSRESALQSGIEDWIWTDCCSLEKINFLVIFQGNIQLFTIIDYVQFIMGSDEFLVIKWNGHRLNFRLCRFWLSLHTIHILFANSWSNHLENAINGFAHLIKLDHC